MSGRDGSPEAVAQRLLELVGERASTAEAEVNVRVGTSALTRFANGAIHQNVAEDIREVGVRVALDGHVATTRLDGPTGDEELGRLVDGVFESARVSPVDADWPGLASPASPAAVDHWDDETAAASPDERATRVAAFVRAAPGLVTAGAISTDVLHASFANSAGQAVSGRATVAILDAIARTPTSDGVARQADVALSRVDAAGAGDIAARKARDGATPTDLAPGRYEVVLEPSCVADIVGFLVILGFGGRAVLEHRSFVRFGEAQLDPAVTLRQDVDASRMSGFGFDAEGTPRATVDLVRDGVPATPLHDRRTARRACVESTGNAAFGPNPYGSVPGSIVLQPGQTDPARLVEGLERGLLVTDFWYTRVLDPLTLVVTGLTRNGVWLVEDGRIVRPVTNMRFTQSYAQALEPGAVRAVGSDAELFPYTADNQVVVPSLHLGSWNFTGGAKG